MSRKFEDTAQTQHKAQWYQGKLSNSCNSVIMQFSLALLLPIAALWGLHG